MTTCFVASAPVASTGSGPMLQLPDQDAPLQLFVLKLTPDPATTVTLPAATIPLGKASVTRTPGAAELPLLPTVST